MKVSKTLTPAMFNQTLDKDSLLRPKPAFSSATHTPQLLLDFVSLDQKTRTEAHDTNKFSSFSPPSFSSPFSSGSSWNEVVAQHKEIGYVRGVVTYMVMDDLMVKPMSTISSISHLNDLEIKDISSVPFKRRWSTLTWRRAWSCKGFI